MVVFIYWLHQIVNLAGELCQLAGQDALNNLRVNSHRNQHEIGYDVVHRLCAPKLSASRCFNHLAFNRARQIPSLKPPLQEICNKEHRNCDKCGISCNYWWRGATYDVNDLQR